MRISIQLFLNLAFNGLLARSACPQLAFPRANNITHAEENANREDEANKEEYDSPFGYPEDKNSHTENGTHGEDDNCAFDDSVKEQLVNVTSLGLLIPQCGNVECSDKEDAICKCDRDCIIFGDCCYSMIETMTEQDNDITAFLQATDRIRKESRFGNLSVNCVGDVHQFSHYYMVDECRTTTYDTVMEPCGLNARYDYNDIPVDHVVDETYIATYRNTYCAICNGIPLEELVSWSVQILCNLASASLAITPEMTLDDIESIEGCQIKPISSYKPRQCNFEIQQHRTCPENMFFHDIDPLTHIFCPLYIYPLETVSIDEEIEVHYRNIHCYVCYNETSSFDSFTCSDADHHKEINGPDKLVVLIDLQVVFSIGSNGATNPTKQCGLINVCDKNEVYDCITKKCRELYCPFGTTVQNGKCIEDANFKVNATLPLDNHPLLNDTNILVLDVRFSTEGKSESEILHLNIIVEAYLRHTKLDILTSAYLQIVNSSSNTLVFEYKVENKTFEIADSIFESVKKNTGNYPMDLVDFSITMRNYYDETFFECLKGYGIYTESDVEIDRPREENVDFNLMESRISLPADSAKWTLVYKHSDKNVLYEASKVYTCIADDDLLPNLNCSMIVFHLNDVILKKDFVEIVEIDVILPEGEFVVHKSKVYICSDSVTNYVPIVDIFEHRQAYRILSIVTSSLTIIGALIVIFTHITKKRLRNGHGLNLTALSGTLLIIHVLLLVQVPTMSGLMCFIYAIILHFALLMMFTWTNIIGVDMARIFLADHVVSRANPTKRFVMYMALSVLIPAGFVALCASLDKTNVPYRPEYAKYGICWLSNSKGVTVFVVAPVVLSLALNVCCFIITVVSIKRKTKQTKMARNNKNHTYVIAFLKMTIILGFTWIFGIVGSMWEQAWLSMLNIILNGLQGVSILICTFVNARNVRHLRETLRSSNVSTSNENKLTSITSASSK